MRRSPEHGSDNLGAEGSLSLFDLASEEFSFLETSDSSSEAAFKDILECFTTMILARDIINAKLHSENLPSVSYRISADYGKVEVATSTSSKGREDLFGSTMNICP